MGVPFVETVDKILRNNVQDVWLRSCSLNRFGDPSYPRISGSSKSIEFQPHGYTAPPAFSKTCSILWTVFTIHLTLIGVFATEVVDKTSSIKLEIKVPNEAKIGSTIELECQWQVYGANELYSVKWYKDEYEFFRYVPDDNPRIQTFSQPGIHIDNSWNNEKSIRLKDLETRSSGQYKCEVSTEAPSFATVYRTANLTVIVMPERGPEITGLSARYTVGEDVLANCTVWPSIPNAAIHWLINGKPIATEKTVQYSKSKIEKEEEEEEKWKEEKEKEKEKKRGEGKEKFRSTTTPSTVGLRVKLKPGHFERVENESTIAIKCIARIGSNQLEAERRVPMDYANAIANNQRLSAGHATNKANGPPRALPYEPLSLIFLFYLCSFLRNNE